MDLRKELEELNETANTEREKKARIKGKMDMLNNALKELGVSAKTAGIEIKKLNKTLERKKKVLEEQINYVRTKFSDKFEKND
jgi:chromosome segregation ATPase